MKYIYKLFRVFGIDLLQLVYAIYSLPKFLLDLLRYIRLKSRKERLALIMPVLGEHLKQSASLDRHYFVQDIICAELVIKNFDTTHLDVGSRVDGFISKVALFAPLDVLDIRPLRLPLLNVSTKVGDLMSNTFLSSFEKRYNSVSCLHTIEHFGLGRYGDKIDPNGFKVGLYNLQGLVKPGGLLFLSTPVGRSRTVFNAHRVFSPYDVFRELSEMELLHAVIINDDGNIHGFGDKPSIDGISAFTKDFNYGLGIFVFRKGPASGNQFDFKSGVVEIQSVY